MNNKIKQIQKRESNLQCCNCIRATDFNMNDEYVCKYGRNSIYIPKPKCKYFKRHYKYFTINGYAKISSFSSKGVTTERKYIRGKFVYRDKFKY